MSPPAAVLQLLAEALGPLRDQLAGLGVTAAVDVVTDRLTGKVTGTYCFTFPRELADKLASKPT